MKLLHMIQSVDLTQGGPIESLVRSDPAWRRLGHSREIVSLDLPGDRWVGDCPIRTHALGSAVVRRWTPNLPPLRYGFTPHLVPWLKTHLHRFDAVVVNGLWNYMALAGRRVLPASGTPYFVFPHGMLDPWFRTAYPVKSGAKQLVWWCAEGPLLHHARAVLFTSEGERSAAQDAFWPYRLKGAIAGYGTAAPPAPSGEQDAAFRALIPALARPYLLFLGRLHRKKGCDLLLRAFGRIAATQPGIDLVMAGPDSLGLEDELRRLADTCGVADRVHWPGMLGGTAKWGALHGCEAFVLPSHGENFGVAVAEAMACGKPVLISDRVNIAPVIEAGGAGLVAPDTVDGTVDLLGRFLSLDRADQAAMGTRAARSFSDNFDIEQVVHRTAALVTGALPA